MSEDKITIETGDVGKGQSEIGKDAIALVEEIKASLSSII